MRRTREIVIDASPIVALVAALGDLTILRMYDTVWVPNEVAAEIVAGGAAGFAVAEFEAAHWLRRMSEAVIPGPALANSLDRGEAAVIQLALDKGISTVCIDEIVGRRIARLHGLVVTGSIGILLRAKQEDADFSMRDAVARMQAKGIRLGANVIDFALRQSGEELGNG